MPEYRPVKLFSYVVARDYGFAPNPFYGYCTLATCKPRIRGTAQAGDIVLGTGSAKNCKSGHIVYVMRVTEVMTYSDYWADLRFQCKRPNLHGSLKQAYGDNIYHKDDKGCWHQRDSHHSYEGGKENPHNIKHDTQTDGVLVGSEYVYWGGSGPVLPKRFRNHNNVDICAVRNHKCNFPPELVKRFAEWFDSLPVRGFQGKPIDWSGFYE